MTAPASAAHRAVVAGTAVASASGVAISLGIWCAIAACVANIVVPASSGTEATAQLVMSAVVRSRTSLRASSSALRFDVSDAVLAPTVIVEFTAAARVQPDSDVVLTVEAPQPVLSPAYSPMRDLTVSFEGGDGQSGVVTGTVPQVVGTWKGSGVRHGPVRFTLHGATAPGSYLLPVRFALSIRP